jgi:hypothetical protein
VADDAFRLSKRMMKPCGQKSCQEEKVFNYRLSRARRVVENAFGILANRFRILQRDINSHVGKVQSITLAFCALHNYIKQKNGKNFTWVALMVKTQLTSALLKGIGDLMYT